MLIVQKFGGSSLANEERIFTAAKRAVQAAKQGHRVIVVVSAQGDTTDDLIARAERIHTAPARREMDAYIAAGEQMSAALMAMAIGKLGCAAVSLTGPQAGILTDGVYGDARVVGLDGGRICRELAAGRIVVVAGFQGRGRRGDIVTLGRGGSDTTAVALAAYLKADKCMIYTDVGSTTRIPESSRTRCALSGSAMKRCSAWPGAGPRCSMTAVWNWECAMAFLSRCCPLSAPGREPW